MAQSREGALPLHELGAWLRLLLTPGIGPVAARRLLAAFGSPQAVFEAPASAWATVLSRREAEALAVLPPVLTEQTHATLAWLEQAGPLGARAVITLGDARYPQALLDLSDPPLLLFAEGRLDLLQATGVAIVGSRHPTPQGRDNAHAFARTLSEAGLSVVSGLALGIDGAAHEGALDVHEHTRGGTVAVLGSGLDQIYPPAHRSLARRISREGLLLSEYPLGTAPRPGHFPRRNRIVAALTRATLVVEAAVQSGSLITARLAAELGREVLAIPGSIHSPQARGCHALIKQGAKLVETAQDIVEELQWAWPLGARSPGPGLDLPPALSDPDDTECEDPVLRAMGHDPVSQEALSARTGMGAAQLGAHLLTLELMGQVARLPGALYQRIVAV